MFERYEVSFDWAKTSGPTDDQDTGFGRAPEPGLPFDRKLKHSLLGAEAAGPGAGPAAAQGQGATATALVAVAAQDVEDDDEPMTETGTDLLELGSWQILKPAWRGHQNAAQKLRSRSDSVKKATDSLRTQLLQTMKSHGIGRVAVTAPTSGCGTTYTALNLALSMAAIPDVTTVLLDLNQRKPGLGEALGHQPVQSMPALLSGEVPYYDYLERYGENLAVGLNSDVPPNPSELLQSQSTADVLDEITGGLTPDVILCDMPPLLEYDDVMAFLPQVDGVLLVVDGTRTVAEDIAQCQKMLNDRVPLLGVVLNRGRLPRKKARRR
ncbi:CpsD/CapB family tyrosine-protein kinase [Roseovarius sp.]|uniref:CpsD/CapB family tyrosine-protein kinase n=1 Tax=Roseovarius sp. TaxID=1486281 RepID=UPI003BAC349F